MAAMKLVQTTICKVIDYMTLPRLSASSIPIQQKHTLDDLKALAACLGENTGKWRVIHV